MGVNQLPANFEDPVFLRHRIYLIQQGRLSGTRCIRRKLNVHRVRIVSGDTCFLFDRLGRGKAALLLAWTIGKIPLRVVPRDNNFFYKLIGLDEYLMHALVAHRARYTSWLHINFTRIQRSAMQDTLCSND